MNEKQAYRDKTWVELSEGEKVERLRQEVRYLKQSLQFWQNAAASADLISKRHSHAADGTVQVPADQQAGCFIQSPQLQRRDLLD